MNQIYDLVLNKLEAFATTQTKCDGCDALLGERYAYWPALTLELASDPKDKGKVKAVIPEKLTKVEVEEPQPYVQRKEFHFCCEDCLRDYLIGRNG